MYLQVINAYMMGLKMDQNVGDDGHIYVISSYLSVLWENHLEYT